MRAADEEQAAREAGARGHLLGAGASSLPRAPRLRGSQPSSAVGLIHVARWRAQGGDVGDDLLLLLLAAPTLQRDVPIRSGRSV
jgi:hypothetical protein